MSAIDKFDALARLHKSAYRYVSEGNDRLALIYSFSSVVVEERLADAKIGHDIHSRCCIITFTKKLKLVLEGVYSNGLVLFFFECINKYTYTYTMMHRYFICTILSPYTTCAVIYFTRADLRPSFPGTFIF